MGKLEKADEKSVAFVTKYFIQFIPHMIHLEQTANRKALYIFQNFYSYSIWILAFGMLTTLAEQLKQDMGSCTYKSFLAANDEEKRFKKECKGTEAFKFSYKIFKAYFKEYIIPDENEEEEETRASGGSLGIAGGDEKEAEEETAKEEAAAFGVSNFFGFNNKKI